jgi:hypothetical protein
MTFMKKYILILFGVMIGGVGGYAYYYWIGCQSGSCPITSQPVNSTIYGAVMGALLVSMFNKK